VIGGHDVRITACVGVATGESLHDRPEDLLARADLVMYGLKHGGQGRLRVLRPTGSASTWKRSPWPQPEPDGRSQKRPY
jgi:predicted signal transduction protein with EAL and GGDEF domain